MSSTCGRMLTCSWMMKKESVMVSTVPRFVRLFIEVLNFFLHNLHEIFSVSDFNWVLLLTFTKSFV